MIVPRLGFGTASVLGGVGSRRSVRAIRQAYELGIRHFDTARSYGWGEAEWLLGKTLRALPRDSYTLVSKCGLVPARRSHVLSFAKSAARQLLRVLPPARGLVRSVASNARFQPTGTYDVRTLSDSVETSLAELGTHYLDLLLLHNFESGKAGLPEVLRWFRELKARGSIRRIGFSVEGELVESLRFLAAQGALEEAVIQVPMSAALLELPSEWRNVSFIAHSPLRYLAKTGRSLGAHEIRDLFRQVARACRCEAIVCSMFSPAHMRSNLAARQAAAALETTQC